MELITPHVSALGEAKSATFNPSGALMDILATTYKNLKLAAIRESIQNACDAAKRAGLSLNEGVNITLPTPEQPSFTISDKGEGMSASFMESTYLSFGSSTKEDDIAAGGLGIGRWAAYGYIGECLISTTDPDLIEHSYFQFKSDSGTPQVQLASKFPSNATGTRISFPVKEGDLEEFWFITCWLKEVMHLSLGDSFSVSNPEWLPKSPLLPESSGIILDLGEENPLLRNVRVHVMRDSLLQLGVKQLYSGSLMVFADQGTGVGGLPFAVSPAQTDTLQSVFGRGTIIEVPFNLNIPFMPSREEIKYTDYALNIMNQIEDAAWKVAADKARALYKESSIASLRLLTRFLGEYNHTRPHCFSYVNNQRAFSSRSRQFQSIFGGNPWSGESFLPVPSHLSATFQRVSPQKTLQAMTLFKGDRHLLSYPPKNSYSSGKIYTFNLDAPVLIVYNDLASGGYSRFRQWLRNEDLEDTPEIIYISNKSPEKAKEMALLIGQSFDDSLSLLPTSSMPSVIKTVSALSSHQAGAVFAKYFSKNNARTRVESSFYCENKIPIPRVWTTRKGDSLVSWQETIPELNKNRSFQYLLRSLHIEEIYLLTPSQAKQLETLIHRAKAQGHWDSSKEDLLAKDPSGALGHRIASLKQWGSLESILIDYLKSPECSPFLSGEQKFDVYRYLLFTDFCLEFFKESTPSPDSRLVSALSKYVDTSTGELKIKNSVKTSESSTICFSLAAIRYAMKEDLKCERYLTLRQLCDQLIDNGQINYITVFQELTASFPLLKCVGSSQSAEFKKDLFKSLSLIY